MRATAIDTETLLMHAGRMAPDLVCLTEQTVGEGAHIYDRSGAESYLRGVLAGANILVGHNMPYDMGVICEAFPELVPLVFAAYDADRITDTKTRQQLLDIAAGRHRGYVTPKGLFVKHGYSLEELTKRIAGYSIFKEGFRLFYSFFRDVPLGGWTAAAVALQARGRAWLAGDESDPELRTMRAILGDDEKLRAELEGMVAADPTRVTEYPLDDARATLAVYLKQAQHEGYLSDQYRQARAAFWLHLSSTWGLRTDREGVEHLRAETQAAYDELFDDLVAAEIVRSNGSRDTKKAKRLMIEVCKREGLPVRRTDAHATEGDSKCKALDGTPLPVGHADCAEHICLDADACNATGDDTLVGYAELSTLKKVLSNDVEALLKGVEYPVHTRYGLADTGRTTSSGPNIQNLRRKAGIREAFVPRPGKVLAAADYPALEAYTLAQCCFSWFGKSKLAEALNAGRDPHLMMAANILGLSYDETKARHEAGDVEVDDVRQLAKVANFGFPGGLGAPKMLASAKKQLKPEVVARLGLDVDRVKQLKEQWFRTWPEMPHYFARINGLCDTEDGKASVETLFTKRVRGGASYCAACNNGFQALGSDCAKHAGWIIAKGLYTDRSSALFNSRLVAFVHDEFIIETDEGRGAHDAAFELARLMCVGANEYLRDVPIPVAKVRPLLMKRWSKKAKPVIDKEGRLIPWE